MFALFIYLLFLFVYFSLGTYNVCFPLSLATMLKQYVHGTTMLSRLARPLSSTL